MFKRINGSLDMNDEVFIFRLSGHGFQNTVVPVLFGELDQGFLNLKQPLLATACFVLYLGKVSLTKASRSGSAIKKH